MARSRRVCLVDPCRFTRSALTEALQRRGVLVESMAERPENLLEAGGCDWLVILSQTGEREPSVRLHRPAGPPITMRREALSLNLLLRILMDCDDAEVPPPEAASQIGSALTQRERDVLRALIEGGSSRTIAEHLGISPKTVENHKASIYSKLGVQSQAQAVAIALRRGLVQPDRHGA